MRSTIYFTHRLPFRLLARVFAILCLVVSCTESGESTSEDVHTFLTIHIETPENGTRADEGPVDGNGTSENGLYQTYIWVFDSSVTSDDAAPVGSFNYNLNGATSTTVQVGIDPDVISRAPNLDVFVVANVESIPSAYYYMGPDNPPITRGRLKDMVFGKLTINSNHYDDFGTSAPTNALVSGKGIPMSQYALNQKVINSGVLDRPVNLALQRAVSKIRFVFARHQEVDDVKILGYTLNEGIIPDRQYVFPALSTAWNTPHLPDGVGYNVSTMSYSNTLSSENILPTDKPEQLTFRYTDGSDFDKSSETAQDYVVRLEQAFINHKPSLSYGLTYLRETDKKLSGTIRYQLGSDEYTAAFEMKDEGDFTRNHEYIVYAYFKKSGLTLTVKAMPWDLQTITNEFSNTVSLADNGMLKWTEGTYFSKDDATKELILKPDINYPAEFTFNLASPRGCVWHAVLRTKSGNPDAFELRDPDGNAKSEGIVDGNEVKLRVHALEQYPAQMNKAELQIVVRCNGITLPVDILTNDKKNFTIIQNKN